MAKDPEKNIPQMLDKLVDLDEGGLGLKHQATTIRDAYMNPKSSTRDEVLGLFRDIDPKQMRKMFETIVVNDSLIGTPIQKKNREKYHCNIPWIVLMDPSSACNLKCTGCWAAEYGHTLSISLDEMENVIKQANDLGCRLFLLAGGEPMDILQQNFHLIPVSQPFKKSLQTKQVRAVYRSALYPRLLVLDKENGGKADALNAGINASLYPIFVSIDADSILENSSLIKIVYSFMTVPTAVAVGGIVRIGSGCEIINGKLTSIRLARRPLLMLQTNEYLRAFLTGRIGFNQMGMPLPVSSTTELRRIFPSSRGSWDSRSETRPPAGVNFIALDNRFR